MKNLTQGALLGLLIGVTVLATAHHITTEPAATRAMANITTENTPDGRCHEDMTCWVCPTMGNGRCGPGALIAVQGDWYNVNAPNRPGCFVEPSNTIEGYEVILYPDIARRNDADLGFEVSCPG